MPRDWPRYAMVLDMHLAGQSLKAISCQIGVSDERVRQMLVIAKHQLAWRVFHHIPHWHYQWDKDKQRYEVAH